MTNKILSKITIITIIMSLFSIPVFATENNSGIGKYGWVQDKGQWYYIKHNGAMATGWLEEGDEWYYLYEDGTMATGWLLNNNEWYYFHEDGTMAKNEMIDGKYRVSGDGTLLTNGERDMTNSLKYFSETPHVLPLKIFQPINK